MPALEVTEPKKLRSILAVFSALDEIRWSEEANYNLINYCCDDLSPSEKFLTHWLCYVTDRQMPFERIWAIGGYVISHLVRSYSRTPGRSVKDLLSSYVKREGKNMRMESPLESSNPRLKRYGIAGNTVSFASRYMPEDLVLIFRTLVILDRIADRSLPRFVHTVAKGAADMGKAIRRVATALNRLTYVAGGAVSALEYDVQVNKEAKKIPDFELMPDRKAEGELFGRKRLWCSLRDYLKSPEFNPIFVEALRDAGASDPHRWERSNPALKAALYALELPGDVWNNAEIFRNGLFRPYMANERKTWDMPRTVRKIYELLGPKSGFYPEQLDVTFDFVPRMCERSMCSVCLFGGGIRETCHQKKGLICPVALHSCGYRHRCNPQTCRFRTDRVRGLCLSSILG
jgi:hypothetical protein